LRRLFRIHLAELDSGTHCNPPSLATLLCANSAEVRATRMPSSNCLKTARIPTFHFDKFDNFGKATVHFCSFSAGDVKCARTSISISFKHCPWSFG
jgi:hypothetical protein